jgi:hypothetical protein
VKIFDCTCYQKTVYNAERIPTIMMDPIAKPVVILNMDVSTSIEWVSLSFLGMIRLIDIIIKTIATKSIVILSKKG